MHCNLISTAKSDTDDTILNHFYVILFLGLFHKAIMSSGTPLNLWSVSPPGWAKRRASSISTFAGCPIEPKKMVQCLKQVPANVLVDLYNSIFVNIIYL